MLENRIIGVHEGIRTGELFICLGGLHGNEPAGVKAIEAVFKMLEQKKMTNKNFVFKGKMLGIGGNMAALALGVRQIDEDLNRIFTPDIIENTRSNKLKMTSEKKELLEILDIIYNEIKNYKPTKITVLDLHTTSAQGSVFAIPSRDPRSLDIALKLHAPVVRGIMEGLSGTVLHFFNYDNLGIDTLMVCFEAGQHADPLSEHRSIAAIIACMRGIGCIEPDAMQNNYETILQSYTKNLPHLSDLLYVHRIAPEDHFKMRPNYTNFQAVKKGEPLADDKNGSVFCPEDCYLLMPLYQPKGSDGFFLIKAASH